MSKLKAFELRNQLAEWNQKYVIDNSISEWANKSAYMASVRNAFGEYPEARERKQRYGRI